MPYYCQTCGYYTKYKGMFAYHNKRNICEEKHTQHAQQMNNIIKTFTTPCIFGWEQTWHIEEPFLKHVNSLDKTIEKKLIIIAQELFLSSNMPQNKTVIKNEKEGFYMVHSGFGKWNDRKKDIVHEKFIEKASDVYIAFLEAFNDEDGANKVSEIIENEQSMEEMKESIDDMLTIYLGQSTNI